MGRMSDLAIEVEETMNRGILSGDPVVDRNIQRLYERSKVGIEKYGNTMMTAPETTLEWIEHAIEEALDFANYLERLKIDIAKFEVVRETMFKDLGEENVQT